MRAVARRPARSAARPPDPPPVLLAPAEELAPDEMCSTLHCFVQATAAISGAPGRLPKPHEEWPYAGERVRRSWVCRRQQQPHCKHMRSTLPALCTLEPEGVDAVAALLLLHPQVPVGLWLHKCRQAFRKGELTNHLRQTSRQRWGRSLWTGCGGPAWCRRWSAAQGRCVMIRAALGGSAMAACGCLEPRKHERMVCRWAASQPKLWQSVTVSKMTVLYLIYVYIGCILADYNACCITAGHGSFIIFRPETPRQSGTMRIGMGRWGAPLLPAPAAPAAPAASSSAGPPEPPPAPGWPPG